jgi:hypothetical protein
MKAVPVWQALLWLEVDGLRCLLSAAGVAGYAWVGGLHTLLGFSFRGTLLAANATSAAWLAAFHCLLQRPAAVRSSCALQLVAHCITIKLLSCSALTAAHAKCLNSHCMTLRRSSTELEGTVFKCLKDNMPILVPEQGLSRRDTEDGALEAAALAASSGSAEPALPQAEAILAPAKGAGGLEDEEKAGGSGQLLQKDTGEGSLERLHLLQERQGSSCSALATASPSKQAAGGRGSLTSSSQQLLACCPAHIREQSLLSSVPCAAMQGAPSPPAGLMNLSASRGGAQSQQRGRSADCSASAAPCGQGWLRRCQRRSA